MNTITTCTRTTDQGEVFVDPVDLTGDPIEAPPVREANALEPCNWPPDPEAALLRIVSGEPAPEGTFERLFFDAREPIIRAHGVGTATTTDTAMIITAGDGTVYTFRQWDLDQSARDVEYRGIVA